MPIGLKKTYFKDIKYNNNGQIYRSSDDSIDDSIKYNNYFNIDTKLYSKEVNDYISLLLVYSKEVNDDISLLLVYLSKIKIILNDSRIDNSIDINSKTLDIFKQINVILIKYKVNNDNNYTEFLSYIENNIDYFQICNRINEIIYYFQLLIKNYGIFILQYTNSEEIRQEFFCFQLYVELRRFRRKNNENIFYIYNNISKVFQIKKIGGVHKYFNISKIIETINCLDEYYNESKKIRKDRIFNIISI